MAAPIPVQASGPGSEPALRVLHHHGKSFSSLLGSRCGHSLAAGGCLLAHGRKRLAGMGGGDAPGRDTPLPKETWGSAVSVEDARAVESQPCLLRGLYGGEGAAGKRFIKKQLEQVGVFRVCFDYAQQVCLCQIGLFTVSCNESHLLLKTF